MAEHDEEALLKEELDLDYEVDELPEEELLGENDEFEEDFQEHPVTGTADLNEAHTTNNQQEEDVLDIGVADTGIEDLEDEDNLQTQNNDSDSQKKERLRFRNERPNNSGHKPIVFDEENEAEAIKSRNPVQGFRRGYRANRGSGNMHGNFSFRNNLLNNNNGNNRGLVHNRLGYRGVNQNLTRVPQVESKKVLINPHFRGAVRATQTRLVWDAQIQQQQQQQQQPHFLAPFQPPSIQNFGNINTSFPSTLPMPQQTFNPSTQNVHQTTSWIPQSNFNPPIVDNNFNQQPPPVPMITIPNIQQEIYQPENNQPVEPLHQQPFASTPQLGPMFVSNSIVQQQPPPGINMHNSNVGFPVSQPRNMGQYFESQQQLNKNNTIIRTITTNDQHMFNKGLRQVSFQSNQNIFPQQQSFNSNLTYNNPQQCNNSSFGYVPNSMPPHCPPFQNNIQTNPNMCSSVLPVQMQQIPQQTPFSLINNHSEVNSIDEVNQFRQQHTIKHTIPFNNQRKKYYNRPLQNRSSFNNSTTDVKKKKTLDFRNLQEVPRIDSNEMSTVITGADTTVVDDRESSTTAVMIPEDEDEETRAYRLKIEEQRKLREKVLKQKEERRRRAALAQAKNTLTPTSKSASSNTISEVVPSITPNPIVSGKKSFVNVTKKKMIPSNRNQLALKQATSQRRIMQSNRILNKNSNLIEVDNTNAVSSTKSDTKPLMLTRRIVRAIPLQTHVGVVSSSNLNVDTTTSNADDVTDKEYLTKFLSTRTVAPKTSAVPAVNGAISSLMNMTPLLLKTNVIKVANLAAGTNELKIRKMCKGVGLVEDIQMSPNLGQAIIRFKNVSHAHNFYKKYQRKMVDLSLIDVTLIST